MEFIIDKAGNFNVSELVTDSDGAKITLYDNGLDNGTHTGISVNNNGNLNFEIIEPSKSFVFYKQGKDNQNADNEIFRIDGNGDVFINKTDIKEIMASVTNEVNSASFDAGFSTTAITTDNISAPLLKSININSPIIFNEDATFNKNLTANNITALETVTAEEINITENLTVKKISSTNIDNSEQITTTSLEATEILIKSVSDDCILLSKPPAKMALWLVPFDVADNSIYFFHQDRQLCTYFLLEYKIHLILYCISL
jgi:hypothetical protein